VGGGGEIAGEDGSVADLGEWGLIAALKARMPAGPLTSVGIGDDSAVVATPSGSVVAAVDLLIEDRHFRRQWSSAYDIGVKAAARSLADIAAMGAVNTALLVALAAPGTLPARWAADLAAGLASEATRAGAGVVGGDTARADVITLSVTALGDLESRPPVLRSGAKPGDVIAVAGTLGHAAAGLALLTAGFIPAESSAPNAHPTLDGNEPDGALTALVAAQLRPAPRYEAGPEAARLGATAMIDVSDGLLADLGHLATASGVQVNVKSASLAFGPGLREAAARVLASNPSSRTTSPDSPPSKLNPLGGENPGAAKPDRSPPGATSGASFASDSAPRATTEPSVASLPLEWVLTGGEDHALVAAFPADVPLPPHWRVIAEVTPGSGVTVDGVPHAGPAGWQHFY
jgi:thiamine-monophosphate kinase